MAEDLTHSAAGHRGLITVFGGTGFLGRRIVRHLLDHRFQVRAASRHPERVGSASQADAGPGTTKADIRDETTVAAALFGAYGAVNAVSPLEGTGFEPSVPRGKCPTLRVSAVLSAGIRSPCKSQRSGP